MSQTSFETLTELAREARDKASVLLAQEQQNQQQIVRQRDALTEYRHDYARELQKHMLHGLEPGMLETYRHFLSSLDQAIERANQALAAQQERVSASRQTWRSEQQRLTSYETVQERQQQRQQRKARRQEQKQADELASQLVQRQLAYQGH